MQSLAFADFLSGWIACGYPSRNRPRLPVPKNPTFCPASTERCSQSGISPCPSISARPRCGSRPPAAAQVGAERRDRSTPLRPASPWSALSRPPQPGSSGSPLPAGFLGHRIGVIVLSVKKMAVANRRPACSKAFRRNRSRTAGAFVSY